MIYLDYAASSPPWPEAAQAVCQSMLSEFGNPGALHRAGGQARSLLQQSRKTIAGLLEVRPEEVFFTSGGTEANNWAVKKGCAPGRKHIVASAAEHKSVLEPLKQLQAEGYSVTLVSPGRDGILSPDAVKAALRPDTGLVCVQAVNNETGVMQDVAGLAAVVRSRGARFLCDGVQSFGHVRQPLNKADFLSLSAHKLGGPRGVGCLIVRYPHSILPLIDGGGQEFGARSGTENTAGIAGFARAAQLSCRILEEESPRLEHLSRALLAGLREVCPSMEVNGSEEQGFPGIRSCWFPGIPAEEMVLRLDSMGICLSPGAACAARDPRPSHVLLSMGYPEQRARQSVRFSLGARTTMEEIEETIRAVKAVINNKGEMRFVR